VIKIPKLSSPEDLKFKERALLFEIYEELKHTSKTWFYIFLGVLVLCIPLYSILQKKFAETLINAYVPPALNRDVLQAKPLEVGKTTALRVGSGLYSAVAQVVNPNAHLVVRSFTYEFSFKGAGGEILKTVAGESFMGQGGSRFVLQPAVTLSAAPQSVSISITNTRFTTVIPELLPKFEILQQKSGNSEEGKFFVEAVVKNPYSFSVRKINVQVLVFDQANRNILAVNQSVLSDLLPLESRYFQVMWPVAQSALFTAKTGQIQVIAEVNPADQGISATQ